jgi:ribulose-phosphate 3-epimerase
MESSIDKVKELKELKLSNGYNYIINIDGGIKDHTLPLVKDYLDLAVSGSYIANAEDPIANLEKLSNM